MEQVEAAGAVVPAGHLRRHAPARAQHQLPRHQDGAGSQTGRLRPDQHPRAPPVLDRMAVPSQRRRT